MTIEEAAVGVRRLLGILAPLGAIRSGHWTREDCRGIAKDVFDELGLVRDLRIPGRRDLGKRVLPEGRLLPAPSPTPWIVEMFQMLMNASAATAMNLAGLKSCYAETESLALHYYDSDPSGSQTLTPLILIHGFYTTAVSMGLIGVLLARRR